MAVFSFVSMDLVRTRHGRNATGRGGKTATSSSTSYGTTSSFAPRAFTRHRGDEVIGFGQRAVAARAPAETGADRPSREPRCRPSSSFPCHSGEPANARHAAIGRYPREGGRRHCDRALVQDRARPASPGRPRVDPPPEAFAGGVCGDLAACHGARVTQRSGRGAPPGLRSADSHQRAAARARGRSRRPREPELPHPRRSPSAGRRCWWKKLRIRRQASSAEG
jgi:hypothetical protein